MVTLERTSLYKGPALLEKKHDSSIRFSKSKGIRPNRFIWHLSYPVHRESILEYGILPGLDNGLCFANNQVMNPDSLWPIVYNDSSYMFNYDAYSTQEEAFKVLDEERFSVHDYWRIDSNIAGYYGYRVDPFQPAEIASIFYRGVSDGDYICRKEPIPSTALKLFNYKPHSIDHYRSFLYDEISALVYEEHDGSVSIGGFNTAHPYFLEEVRLPAEVKFQNKQ
ncbi:MAG: hypothetical protein ACK43L_02155 [Sphingobacteriales bacterium]|jgi:hypothetical protein